MKSEPKSCLGENLDVSKHAWSPCGVGSQGQLCKCCLASRFGVGAPMSVWAPEEQGTGEPASSAFSTWFRGSSPQTKSQGEKAARRQ